ncbi:MAG: hypothetical protein EON90_09240 [Brevundimonas sp.]|nr:MAG: hypothetical protein EON90_09240 [Brevundimonas sp.]
MKLQTRSALAGASLAIVLACAAAARAQSADLAGQWVYEGTNQELVIRSSIQQRSYAMPGDFSFGGATPNTVISTTPTPTRVHRRMALVIEADNDFSWITEKSYDESAQCRVNVTQRKVGRLSAAGAAVTFEIRQGSDRATRSCNDRVSESDRGDRSETYRVTRSGSTLSVNDGTVTWTFRRYSGQ